MLWARKLKNNYRHDQQCICNRRISERLPYNFLCPRTSNATQCEQYRTISLITHACKILLHIIKECQFGFRKGSGTREAIYILRTMGERMIQLQKDLCIAFIDYTKAFDGVNHCKLLEVMKTSRIPFDETKLIANLYWKQSA